MVLRVPGGAAKDVQALLHRRHVVLLTPAQGDVSDADAFGMIPHKCVKDPGWHPVYDDDLDIAEGLADES
jgi:hypothetical protein